MPNLTVVAALMASLIGGPSVADPPQPQSPGPVTVELAYLVGSGCAPGSAYAWVSPDNSNIGIVYSGYTARIGPTEPPVNFRKNCQAYLVVHVPSGWSYAVTGHEHVAAVDLADGASATLRVDSFFLSRPRPPVLRIHTFTGPLNDEVAVNEATDFEFLEYSRCNVPETLEIATDLRVLRGTSDPTRVYSAIALELNRNIHLTFRPCTPA